MVSDRIVGVRGPRVGAFPYQVPQFAIECTKANRCISGQGTAHTAVKLKLGVDLPRRQGPKGAATMRVRNGEVGEQRGIKGAGVASTQKVVRGGLPSWWPQSRFLACAVASHR